MKNKESDTTECLNNNKPLKIGVGRERRRWISEEHRGDFKWIDRVFFFELNGRNIGDKMFFVHLMPKIFFYNKPQKVIL